MPDLRAKQDLNRGFSDAFGRGFELALTPVVFGGLGWLVDRAVGTAFAFTLAFAIVGVVGIGVRMWLGYDRQMREHEAGVAGFRRRGTTSAPPAGDTAAHSEISAGTKTSAATDASRTPRP